MTENLHVEDRVIRISNISAFFKISGSAHVTYNGKEIPERQQPIIECRCNCYSFFSPKEQTKIFQTFNRLKDHSTQNTYLQGCVQVKASDRITRRLRQENGRQQKSFTYSVTCERKTIYVCQAAFLCLHGIKKSRLKRKVLNLEAHILDGRGSHANHAKIDKAVKNRMRKHIQLFQLVRVTTAAHKTSIKNILMLHCQWLKCTELLLKQTPIFNMFANTASIIKFLCTNSISVSDIHAVIYAICVKNRKWI